MSSGEEWLDGRVREATLEPLGAKSLRHDLERETHIAF
jgi:hypothetical protein